MKKRFTEEWIIGFLRGADASLPVKEPCRRHEFSEAPYYHHPTARVWSVMHALGAT